MWVPIRNTWRALRGRSRWEQDLDEELRLHVQLRADDLVRSGLAPDAAGPHRIFVSEARRLVPGTEGRINCRAERTRFRSVPAGAASVCFRQTCKI